MIITPLPANGPRGALSMLRCLHDWRSSPKRKARPPSVTDRWTGPSTVPAAMGHLSVRRGGLVAQPGLLDRILGLAHTAQYPVGDREQQRPQLLELLGPGHASPSLKPWRHEG